MLTTQGITINVQENYNSVPGLRGWYDGRERVTHSSNKISAWGDKSKEGNHLLQPALSRQVDYDNGLWIKSVSIGQYLMSHRRDFKFLHNGAKYGIYSIQKNSWSLATPHPGNGSYSFSSNNGTGLQQLFNSGLSSGRMEFIIQGGVTKPAKNLTNLLNPASPNYSPSDQIWNQSLVNLGQVNGVALEYGNAITNYGRWFGDIASYPQGNHEYFIVCNSYGNTIIRIGLLLIYDWSLYTDAQVLEFDAKVRAMRAVDKLIFENLDTL